MCGHRSANEAADRVRTIDGLPSDRLTPEARDQRDSLYAYISTAANADIASRFVDGIIDHVATLTDFPNRGTPRADIRAGLRTIPWRRCVTIAFVVEETELVIIGIFYGGRDFESLLRDD